MFFVYFQVPQECCPAAFKKHLDMINLQLEVYEVQSEFSSEIRNLELKFQSKFNKVYDRRCDIVAGKCDGEYAKEYCVEKGSVDKGIPDFWLTVLQNVSSTSRHIKECDVAILKVIFQRLFFIDWWLPKLVYQR